MGRMALGFGLGRTDEALTAHGGLALMAEYQQRLRANSPPLF